MAHRPREQQITFGRLRISATGGLCAGAQYLFVTPYGPVPFTANAAGGIARNVGTEDIGCGPVAPATCAFGDALGSRIAKSFPRWDPAAAPAAPAGYLGVPGTLHPITGGTYVPDGANQPVNYAAITDLAGNVIGRTDKFLVSGKVAGPLQSDLSSVDFLHSQVGQITGDRTVTATNVAGSPTTVSSVSLTGVNAAEFRLSAGGTCAAAVVAADATCQVKVAFAPSSARASRTRPLRITPATGDPRAGGADRHGRSGRRAGCLDRPGRARLRHRHRAVDPVAEHGAPQHRQCATGGGCPGHHRGGGGRLLGHHRTVWLDRAALVSAP